MRQYMAEFIGTFFLVFIGCGAAAIGGDKLGILGICMAFGFAIIAIAYSIGPLSGGHANPAVTLGMLAAGRINPKDTVGYIIFQCLGAIIAAGVLALLVSGKLSGYSIAQDGLGQNGWGYGIMGGYDFISALIFEFIATFIFVTVVIQATQEGAPRQLAGFAIGTTLAAVLIVGSQITGGSVNPARSLGPAIFAGGTALNQLWLFLVIPSFGGLTAGLLFRYLNLGLTPEVIPEK